MVRGGVDGSDPSSWLVREPSTGAAPLRYTPKDKGDGALDFVPYFDLGDEPMTTFPCYATR